MFAKILLGLFVFVSIQEKILAASERAANYVSRRNVKDYGAKGDGVTDDTSAIIRAITEGRGDDPNAAWPTVYSSASITPALVYFPPGTYLISDTIPFTYYTQLVGDADNTPSIKMLSSGSDKRMIDSLSESWGGNLVNQNNFFHHMRNFVLDMSECDSCTGIHWQVAQATQLSNIYFKMKKNSKCQGIWMENGSGGFISDLVFEGGLYGLWVGNQQFTSRNITIRDASAAGVYLNWDWGWTFKSLQVENSPIGIDVGSSTGTLLVMDSHFKNIGHAVIRTQFNANNGADGVLNNNLVLDNVVVDHSASTATSTIVSNMASDGKETVVLTAADYGGTTTVLGWVQGKIWKDGAAAPQILDLAANGFAPKKPAVLTPADSSISKIVANAFFEMGRPAFDSAVKYVKSCAVKDFGIANDGKTDVTSALQSAISTTAKAGKVLFLPSGTYLVSDLIYLPAGTRILGEAWSTLMVTRSTVDSNRFMNASHPETVFQVGQPGEVGVAQLVDLLITTQGPLPGAKLVEWNMAGRAPGEAGMWEVHFRIGGAIGTNIDPSTCPRGDGSQAPANNCFGSWALMHITASGSAYLENIWGWVADHDLDYDDQINVYNARGLLVESKGPVWMYGTAFEHSLLYQYNLNNAENVLLAMIQTETPYFQPAPLTPFLTNGNNKDSSSLLVRTETDPVYCDNDSRCAMAFAVNVDNHSKDIYFYGTGLYSFFNLWNQDCLYSGTSQAPDCQLELTRVSTDSSQVWMYQFNTYGSVYMTQQSEGGYSAAAMNMNTFCSTAAVNLNHY
jgi:glucan 1,3-beta-glucosidase